jgi:hypothetical protein
VGRTIGQAGKRKKEKKKKARKNDPLDRSIKTLSNPKSEGMKNSLPALQIMYALVHLVQCIVRTR